MLASGCIGLIMTTLVSNIRYRSFPLFKFVEFHDDVIKWKHFPRNWPFVRGIHQSPVNSPHKDQWRGALMLSLICVWINDWVNNREAGDLRRYRIHYDVIVMYRNSILPSCDLRCLNTTSYVHYWSHCDERTRYTAIIEMILTKFNQKHLLTFRWHLLKHAPQCCNGWDSFSNEISEARFRAEIPSWLVRGRCIIQVPEA